MPRCEAHHCWVGVKLMFAGLWQSQTSSPVGSLDESGSLARYTYKLPCPPSNRIGSFAVHLPTTGHSLSLRIAPGRYRDRIGRPRIRRPETLRYCRQSPAPIRRRPSAGRWHCGTVHKQPWSSKMVGDDPIGRASLMVTPSVYRRGAFQPRQTPRLAELVL